MKSVRWMIALGIVVLAACGPPPPPAGTVEAVAVAPLEAPPVFALIGVRERLQLTSEQITALDSIGRWNASANEAALRQLRRRDARGAPLADVPLDSLVAIVRNNNLQATREVESLLSEQQQEQVCTLFPARQRRTALAGPRRTQPREQDRLAAADDPRHFVWPWCLPAEEDPTEQPPPLEVPPQEVPPQEPAPPPGG